MLTSLDTILYPDDISLVDFGTELVFPIYKNGSSSIFLDAKKNNRPVYTGKELKQLDLTSITVFVRNPDERFISGIRTFVHNLVTENKQLDVDTINFLVQKYLYLDIHFLPQFHWLLNLTRLVGANVPLKIQSIESINHFTGLEVRPDKNQAVNVNTELFQDLYLQLDTILFNQIGNSLTFSELLTIVKNDSDAKFDQLIELPSQLLNILK